MDRTLPGKRRVFSFLLTSFLAFFMIPARPGAAPQKEAVPHGGGCLGCHRGIEVINQKMARAWSADKNCAVCHSGRPYAATHLEAHTDLIANPGDLRVIDRTCGKCHSDYGELRIVNIRGVANHVGRVLRSLMATAAGEIAGTRYLWNAQKTRSAIYGVRAISSFDGEQREGAVPRLRILPPASASDADSLLRGACLRCHLWTEDKTSPGIFRPAGCSACHVLYDQRGLSRSDDPTISKDEPGHPVKHVITTKIPDLQCLWCHNNGGGRLGLSYIGLGVVHSSLEAEESGPGEKTAYGARVMHVKPDVHYRRGIACIDCHDTVDLHGDGTIYSHQEYQVGIRCESCHGTSTKPPAFRTERGDALTNVDIIDRKPFLRTKIFQDTHLIPVLYTASREPSWLDDIWHRGHQRLECYACHSTTLPQCYGCHMTRDDSSVSPIDWAIGLGENQPGRDSVGRWTGRKLFQMWDEPVLGVNRRDRVAPFMPGGQAILTHLDSAGEQIKLNHTFTTSGGLYGFSMSPTQPHTISAESRTCSSCHSSRKALGLGTGFVDLKRLGLPLIFSPDRIVDETGGRIQDSAHDGVRPFSGEELAGLFRTETCVDCHQERVERVPPASSAPSSLNEEDKRHHEAIRSLSVPEQMQKKE